MDVESRKSRGIVASLKSGSDDATAEGMQELSRLAETADIQVVAFATQSKSAPDPWSYFGAGKVEELRNLCETLNAQVLLVNDDLSPGQEQALKDLLGVEVLDRTALILKIFASHARTREAKLQVELASLRHQLTRLRGKGESMSRTGGGIGTRGPGEQELEVKRRLIRDRIRHISKEIEAVNRRRLLYRERRKKAGIPVVALAGYTNAGKSTLFKKLTGRDVLVEDKLFSTLDTRGQPPWSPAPGLPKVALAGYGWL
ncbi:MAG: GTPase HflX [Firmicutes bacterium]|nr:GTPase HflX [Candidatus Fermentithermobacillaceae bacterium]